MGLVDAFAVIIASPIPIVVAGHEGVRPTHSPRLEKSTIAAYPVSVPIAKCEPPAFHASVEIGPWPGGATGRMREEPISASTTSPSAKPPATMSSFGWQATCAHVMPSPPASSSGALPIGPPPKNGHSTMASAPLVASHLPVRLNDIDCVLPG